MKITIFGLGGVGAYLATRFTSHGLNVSCIVRGAHKKAIEENGLKFVEYDKSITVTHPYELQDDTTKMEKADVVFVCVKGIDLKASCETLRPVVKDGTLIIPVLNGVAASRILQEEFPNANVINCCTYITSMITAPGEVTMVGKFAKFNLGQGPKAIDETTIKSFVEFLKECDIDAEYRDDILVQMWTKYFMFSAYSACGTYFNASIGHLTGDEEKREILLKLLNENASVAKALNIGLPDNIVETTYSNLTKYDPLATTSLQRDMHTPGKGNEWELIQGEMVRLAKSRGVETPTLEMIYNKFKK